MHSASPDFIRQPTDVGANSASTAPWLPSALIWSIVFVSFSPFSSGQLSDVAKVSGGDTVNQLGFGVLGIVCVLLIATRASWQALSAFASPIWLFFLPLIFAASVLVADSPNASMRAMIFSVIVLLAAFTAMATLRTKEQFVSAFAAAIGITLAFCYIAIFVFPTQGVHGAGGHESQHAGLWRGVYDHKNAASYVMAIMALGGLYVMRSGKPAIGLILTTLAVLFVLQARSKTVLGILPVALFLPIIARWVTYPPLRLIVILVPVIVLMIVTVGAVIYPPLLEFLRGYVAGLSYTGRTDLWEFSLAQIEKSPWVGYGFQSFWTTPRITTLEQPIELNWDVRGIVHGHNAWLDAMVAFGIPGAIVLFYAIVYVPVRDYLSIPDHGNAAKLATLFISIWLICAFGASLESFFMRRADPMWFSMVIAVVGLRLTAHMHRRRSG